MQAISSTYPSTNEVFRQGWGPLDPFLQSWSFPLYAEVAQATVWGVHFRTFFDVFIPIYTYPWSVRGVYIACGRFYCKWHRTFIFCKITGHQSIQIHRLNFTLANWWVSLYSLKPSPLNLTIAPLMSIRLFQCSGLQTLPHGTTGGHILLSAWIAFLDQIFFSVSHGKMRRKLIFMERCLSTRHGDRTLHRNFELFFFFNGCTCRIWTFWG